MEMEWEKELETHIHDYIQNRCSVDKFVQEFIWCNNLLKTKFFHCRAYFIEALEPLHTPQFVQAALLMINLFNRDGVCLYYEDWNRANKPKSLPGESSALPQMLCRCTPAT